MHYIDQSDKDFSNVTKQLFFK